MRYVLILLLLPDLLFATPIRVGWVDLESIYSVKDGKFEGYNEEFADCLFAKGNYQFIEYPSVGRKLKELEKGNIELAIYVVPDKDRSKTLTYIGDTWGVFAFSMFSLTSRSEIIRKKKNTEILVATRIKSIALKFAKNAGYTNLVEVDKPSKMLKMLGRGYIDYYVEADILMHRFALSSDLELSDFSRKNLVKVPAGTYADPRFIALNPNFQKKWDQQVTECVNSKEQSY